MIRIVINISLLLYAVITQAQYQIHCISKDGNFSDTMYTKQGVWDSTYRKVAGVYQGVGKLSTRSYLSTDYIQGSVAAGLGYTLSVQALTSSPADGATIYFGQLPKAPTTTANISKVYIRKAGTIKVAQVYCYSGTAGTGESWTVNIRLNNTTDTQIASVASATNERIFTNSSLSITVNAGDYIEIKCVNPTWATNPLTTIFGGYIYIE